MSRRDLEAARRAWCLYDWANSAFATVVLAALLPVYFAALVPDTGAQLSFFGLQRTLPASALWGYAVAASLAIVALAAPFLGAVADRQGLRRPLLILFTLIGATATSLLACAGPGRYLLAIALFIVANAGFAAGNIFYNAFLPALASGADLDRLSSRGYALGYLGGGLMLLLAFILIQWHGLFGLPGKGEATRCAFLLTGLWWGGFALPAFHRLRDDLLPPDTRPPLRTLGDYLRTLAALKRHRDLLRFLLAFLFFNDGIQTIIAVSAIFGSEELGLSTTTILGVFLMIQFVAWPGALLYGRIATRFGAKRAIAGGLVFFIFITLFAYAMRTALEFWILGFAVALVLGGCQALSRSLYAALTPPAQSAEFFAFFAISGKFASILGPFLFALIIDLTGSARLAILTLATLFVIGLALLAAVDVERGRKLVDEENS
jgi:UMF1 family MFS transporter